MSYIVSETSVEAYNRMVRSGWAPPEQVANLRAEIERLRTDNEALRVANMSMDEDNDLRAEIERLQAIVIAQDNEIEEGMAEIERLQAALAEKDTDGKP